jgi:hypothetical protein
MAAVLSRRAAGSRSVVKILQIISGCSVPVFCGAFHCSPLILRLSPADLQQEKEEKS